MLFLRLEHIDLLLNATSILTQSSNNADLRISPSKLSIITFNNSHRFFATFQILPESFVDYFVDRNHGFMMFIHSFRNAMLEGRIYPFMRIRLKENTSRIVLTFETPSLWFYSLSLPIYLSFFLRIYVWKCVIKNNKSCFFRFQEQFLYNFNIPCRLRATNGSWIGIFSSGKGRHATGWRSKIFLNWFPRFQTHYNGIIYPLSWIK